MYSTRYSCQILVKLEFSQQIFENYSNINFHKNICSGAELFHAGRWMDTQTNMTKLIVAF